MVLLVPTFIIYNFLLVPTGQVHAYDGHFMASCFVHIFTPLLVTVDCIINGRKNVLDYSDLFLYFFAVFIYGFSVIIYKMSGGLFLGGDKYPYFIFDVDRYELAMCIIMNFVAIFVYEIIGFIVILINRNVVRKEID